MSSQEVNDLIQEIRAKANALEYTEDGLAFDKAVGEIDLLCYRLRTVAWPRPKPVPEGVRAFTLAKPAELHEALRDLFGE